MVHILYQRSIIAVVTFVTIALFEEFRLPSSSVGSLRARGALLPRQNKNTRHEKKQQQDPEQVTVRIIDHRLHNR